MNKFAVNLNQNPKENTDSTLDSISTVRDSFRSDYSFTNLPRLVLTTQTIELEPNFNVQDPEYTSLNCKFLFFNANS